MNALRRSPLLSLLLACIFGLFAVQPAFSSDRRPAQLFGTARGVFALAEDGSAVPLWTDGGAMKIARYGAEYFVLGDRGIVASSDLIAWESRNAGLPVKTLKKYDGVRKSFDRVAQELKDLEADPSDPRTLVTAVKDVVFLSRDGGRSWKNLGIPVRTNGIKAVAVASMPDTVVFVSHAIYGVHYLEVDKKGAKWTELNAGLDLMETTQNPDEVSDLLVVPGSEQTVWAAQTFKASIYRLDWVAKRFVRVWTDGREFGSVDSLDMASGLSPSSGAVRFVRDGSIGELRLSPDGVPSVEERHDLSAVVARAGKAAGSPLTCILTDEARLSELWLLPFALPQTSKRAGAARGKEGLYLPVNHATEPRSLAPYLGIIEDRGLDMVVVDMKDDYGRLRFNPRNPAIRAKGRVFNPVDVEAFAAALKPRGIWLVARVVVFKDPSLAAWSGGKYAVWDQSRNAPWQGYRTVKRKADPSSTDLVPSIENYDEKWVDPYSEEVWEYTAAICRELVERGFDEIQFDYIRFPTDGENLSDARYRWRDQGMDMESAILSFLSHARSRIDAPISIDIYGANGWYRTGARTGQEVELLSHYVDVICPMYYPSHFEQDFLALAPLEERPFRIYYRGTLRAERIARSRVVIRPYVQSFYLNVSYDRKYYGADYVKFQVEGVRAAGSPGLTYWNNVGRYDEIPPAGRPLTAEAEKRGSTARID